MPSTRFERILAALGVVAVVALGGFAVPAALDYRSFEPPAPDEATATAGARAPSDPAATATVERSVQTLTERARPAATSVTSRATLELVAARGDCWLDVRLGSADGRSLFAGILAQGESRRFAGAALWVEIGAAAALDVTLNGKPVSTLPQGPTTVAVTPEGVRPIPA